MHFVKRSFFLAAVFCFIGINSAKAEVFFIEDQVNRFSISFPDLWIRINNQKPDDELTIAGPGEPDFAMCRVRVREDRRFLIYPRKFADSIQKVGYSRDFWNKYLGEYDDVYVDDFREPTGLGKGFGSFTEATYTTAEGTIMRKRGLMFASLYHDKAYIVDCSAEESVYEKWRPAFMGVVKSVDFEKVVHELPSGNYRNFMADPQVVINGGPKKVDVYRY
ncbi:MAG: hypothetical protein KA099_10745 [Alphaproteobacteria bacterium]|nr:hypothetical protein [Alphaproteobacteria bacterium]MBP7758935.1 hypothetical protein [Alphaproteobacteria bacterium]MBP7762210.1 hypothetical protein [Alphaproteobacteria bacterium]MBP7905793.1 hypothetical protein [Alphaproteobacteria bacterium]